VYGYDPAQTEESVRQHVEAYETAKAANEKIKEENEKVQPWQQKALRTLTPPDPDGVRKLYEDGASRNIMRAMKNDGMRVMGLLAKFLEKDEDPVHLVVRLMIDAGYDVEAPEDMNEEE
jgi:hypothetical protein